MSAELRADWIVELPVEDKNAAAAAEIGAVDVDQLSTPFFGIDLDAVTGNVATMARWTAQQGAMLAPHGKTTMCPGLWWLQLDAGAWGITVANEPQLRVARSAGVQRVIVANELVSPMGLRWLAGELSTDAEFDVTCWVDSLDGVRAMESALAAARAQRPVGVCVELGAQHARGGARTPADAKAVAEAVVAAKYLELRGVSGYEGSIHADSDEQTIVGIRAYLADLAGVFVGLADRFETEHPILTAGGSAYFDLVVDVLSPARDRVPGAQLVLRSGSYVVHDDGTYRHQTPSATRSGPAFTAAAHVWARVLSTPEPGLALLDVGKRDIPYDSGLPEVQIVYRRRGDDIVQLPPSGALMTATNDQHGYVHFDVDGALRVGDVVRLGISHPCTIFDKWRSVLILRETDSAALEIGGACATFF